VEELVKHRAGEFVIVNARTKPIWDADAEPEMVSFFAQIETVKVYSPYDGCGGRREFHTIYKMAGVPIGFTQIMRDRYNPSGELWLRSDEVEEAPHIVERVESLRRKYGMTEKEAFEVIHSASQDKMQDALQRLYLRFLTLGIVEGDPKGDWADNETFCKIKVSEVLDIQEDVEDSGLVVLEDWRH